MQILDKIGMNPANRGYTYWQEALKIRKGNYFDLKMGDIYSKISKKFNVTLASVERCMRHSRITIKDLNKKFSVDYKIDNKKFLALLIKNS